MPLRVLVDLRHARPQFLYCSPIQRLLVFSLRRGSQQLEPPFNIEGLNFECLLVPPAGQDPIIKNLCGRLHGFFSPFTNPRLFL